MNKQPCRYAHEGGRVGLCFDTTGDHIITCGSEGDVRIFAGFEDDDAITHRIGETVFSVAYQGDRLYTASDDNAVQIHTFKEGQPDGLMTRFTAPVTTMCFSKDGGTFVAGSSDFTVKRVQVEDKAQKVLLEHEAPVLHVAIHPNNTLVASSSCDGTLQIYDTEQEKVVKKLTVFPKSNDITTSKTHARMCWDLQGKLLFVPKEKEIVAYDSSTWDQSVTFTYSSITELVSIVCLSPCGKYIAAATQNGWVLVFDVNSHKCISKDQHSSKTALSGLAWNPNGNHELAWVDVQGNLGIYQDVIPAHHPAASTATTAKSSEDALNAQQLDELFDDVDDDMLLQASGQNDVKADAGSNDVTMTDDIATTQIGDADSDDDDDGPTQKVNKSRVTRIQDDDESSMDTDMLKPAAIDKILDDDDDAASIASAPAAQPAPVTTIVKGFEPTPMQRAFQPGATPTHCAHRFMKWNSVGIIMQYNTDDENSINIEFHDSATHHALHVTNTMGHTMADLSSEAVLLACDAEEDEEDTASKLVCMHFASWDNSKEWSTSMPKGEEIQAITLGDGWCAVGTDKRVVRIFSLGGIQRDIISIPGPVVALTGHMHQLLVVYHRGMALPGDQCMGVKLLHVTGKKKTVIAGDDLPLTHKAALAWIGFSAEGTPFSVDSTGIVRMLNRSFGNNWVQVANMRKNIKGKSDNYWVVGIHENPQQIRSILCKGARFPPTLPRPNVTVLPFEVPLCEMSTDKGTMEENIMRSALMSQHFDWWSAQGFDYDEMAKSRAAMPQQEALMKLFALACKTDREYRAVEICELMPSAHTVQLAIKYASRLRLLQLAERLGVVAREKAEEELRKQGQVMDSDEEEEEEVQIVAQPRPWGQRNGTVSEPVAQEAEEESGEDELDEEIEDEEGDIVEQVEAEEIRAPPQLKMTGDSSLSSTPKAPTMSQNAKKNPFKVASQKFGSSGKGTSVFDSMEKPKQKPPGRSPFDSSLQKKTKVLKKPKSKNASQGRLFGKTVDDNAEKEPSESKSKSGFDLWFYANKDDLEEEHPDLSSADLTIQAARAFKQLPAEDKKEWNEKAKSQQSDADESRKRKREEADDVEDTENRQKKVHAKESILDKGLSKNTSSKLAAFSFSKS